LATDPSHCKSAICYHSADFLEVHMSGNLLLLDLLADGEIHSGEELSAVLGVSRTAIWKQLQKLQDVTGLELESIKGRGYRLIGGLERIDGDRVIDLMSPGARGLLGELNVCDQVDSTNSLALQKAQESPQSGYVVVAEQQLAGRGRRGKKWVSPYGCNIYCSIVWQFQNGAAALEGLSLAVGVAVARALKGLGVSDVGMKWPNDVICKERKLAGILLEMIGDAAGRCQVVIGVGINVSMAKETLAAVIDQPWTDVNTAAGTTVSRNKLLAGLLSELLPVLTEFEAKGFATFRTAWSAMDIMFGKEVVVHLGEQAVFGTAAGVGDNGSLAIDTESGRQWFHGGEVSLRLRG
jgi:BirA family transcriptional regulator, biotin operon repressor / biotin---[acetyl-CoA-carboxylase] ligase